MPQTVRPATDPLATTAVGPLRTPESRLPAELIGQTRRRLGVISLMFTALPLIVGVATFGLLARLDPEAFRRSAFYGNGWLFVSVEGVSLVVFGLSRWKRLSARNLADLALLYEILLAFAFATFRHLNRETPSEAMPNGVSFVCVIVVIFPLVVPNTVRRAVTASFLAGLAEVPAILLSVGLGRSLPDFTPFLALVLPNLVCALLTIIPLRAFSQLARDVSRARELGSYRLTQKLGEGGMGEVWRAEHRMLARPAAVKLINPERLGVGADRDTVVRRFEREAQATAALNSPHTIDVFDFGITADGVCYYVMELLDGHDLDSFIDRFGPMPAERVAYILQQTCDSLIDAHRAGLIHRDIKPANVYLCRYGHRVDYVKVLDFGLVKLHGDLTRGTADLTVEGTMPGTPAFLAPEIALARDDVDARADLYSLGCVAYWMLTGQLVFESDSPLKTVFDHVQKVPEPPSARSELDVPRPLEDIVMACLAKEPADRPADAETLQRQLVETGLAEAWTPERAQRWWQRHLPGESGERARAVIATAERRRIVPS